MAGDWIKFELATSDKPEVWIIADSIGIDPDAVVGKLLRVWGWFDQQTENGNAPTVTKMLLDRLVGVTGFCKAVIDAGWMMDDGVNIFLPHFDRHNGKTAKNRAVTAKRVASFKNKASESNDGSNAAIVTNALPKEEKRREDNILSDAPRAKPSMITFSQWIESLDGEDAIPSDDSVFSRAEKIGISSDYLALAWYAFRRQHTDPTSKSSKKKYAGSKGWRIVFAKAVLEDWLKLWAVNSITSEYYLTTKGRQLMQEMNNEI